MPAPLLHGSDGGTVVAAVVEKATALAAEPSFDVTIAPAMVENVAGRQPLEQQPV